MIDQEYVDATKHVIDAHGLQFLMHAGTPNEVIAEALRQLAKEYDE